jgi:hypothetical protein
VIHFDIKSVYEVADVLFPMAQQPLTGQGLLIIKASRSQSDTPHLVGPLLMSDQPEAEASA